jgi:hypothetical protein
MFQEMHNDGERPNLCVQCAARTRWGAAARVVDFGPNRDQAPSHRSPPINFPTCQASAAQLEQRS